MGLRIGRPRARQQCITFMAALALGARLAALAATTSTPSPERGLVKPAGPGAALNRSPAVGGTKAIATTLAATTTVLVTATAGEPSELIAIGGRRRRRRRTDRRSSGALGRTAAWAGLDGDEMNSQLVELLAEFYAHSQQVEDRLRAVWRQLEGDAPAELATSGGASQRLEGDRDEGTRGEGGESVGHLELEPSSKLKLGRLRAERLARLKMQLGAEGESLLRWFRQRQQRFDLLKNVTFELIASRPNSTINVCPDGPKILVLQNVSDIYYCYTRDQWHQKLWSDLSLSTVHYPIIALHLLVFLFGATGNVFVCLSVKRNHQLRSVTNYFIVNLAFADLLVILICLPATVVWDLSLTWFFDTVPCKLIIFLQVSRAKPKAAQFKEGAGSDVVPRPKSPRSGEAPPRRRAIPSRISRRGQGADKSCAEWK